MIVYSFKLVFVTLSRTRNYFLGTCVCMNFFGISMHTGSPSKSNGSRQPPPSLNQAIENGLVIRHHAKSKISSIQWIVSKDQKVTGNLPFLSDKHTSSKPAFHSTTL